MRPEVLREALMRAGATFLDEQTAPQTTFGAPITKADFYAWGLTGGENSTARRRELLRALDLPEHMTANALLEFINAVGTREEVESVLQKFSKNS